MGREVLEGKFAIIPIVGVQPADPAFQGIFTHILQKPLEPLIKNLVQKFGVGLVSTSQGKGLAHKIVGFLIHHQSKLVIHQPIVGKVVNFLKFAILANDCALAGQNVMETFIVGIPGNLFFPLAAPLPFINFSGEKLKFSHAGIAAHQDQAIDPGRFSISKQRHIQSPSFLSWGGLKSNGALSGFLQGQRLV